MKLVTFCLAALTTALPDMTTNGMAAELDPSRGQQLFARACVACHSVETDKNMTGPSLAGIWDRIAGSLPSFTRYSPALKESGVVWTSETLDAWLADPAAFVPGNHMVFAGIADAALRADLLAFLKNASKSGTDVTQADDGMGGMMSMGTNVPNLKSLSASAQITGIDYCPDTYSVTTADGETAQYWERNLRFKTDSSEDGPQPGAPAMVPAGMMGDRASAIFATPEEFGEFIKRTC